MRWPTHRWWEQGRPHQVLGKRAKQRQLVYKALRSGQNPQGEVVGKEF
jgi:hypothetical protein